MYLCLYLLLDAEDVRALCACFDLLLDSNTVLSMLGCYHLSVKLE